jgi:hypothetical protein
MGTHWRVATFAALALGPASARAQATPYVPTGDDVVLERATPEKSRRPPLLTNADAAAAFARQAIEQGRASSDPRRYGHAQAALAPWWDSNDPPAPIRLLRATLLQQRHDFGGALKDVDVLIGRDPTAAQPRLLRAVIHLVQGRPELARPDCAAVISTSLHAGTVCLAQVQALTGHAHAALRLLDAIAPGADDAPEGRWGLTLAAEISARLDAPDTDARFARALDAMRTSTQDDPYLLDAAADHRIATGRPADAMALLAGRDSVDSHLLRMAIAARALRSSAAAGLASALGARFSAAQRRGDEAHLREKAMWLLLVKDDPGAALPVAAANWSVQREPADARLLLETALRASQPQVAEPALAWMHATRIEDTRLQGLAVALRKGP